MFLFERHIRFECDVESFQCTSCLKRSWTIFRSIMYCRSFKVSFYLKIIHIFLNKNSYRNICPIISLECFFQSCFVFISVVKEPPYSVKESGYAGFNFPIEVYLKNRDEPKKIKFNYDLHLQNAGPAIKKVRNEPYVFQSPSDEFRRKLLKGGGAPVSSSNSLHSNVEHERNSRDSFTDEKPQQLIGKPKLGGDSAKKHKTKEYRIDDAPRPSNTFENLFGVTIHKTSRNSPDPKKPSPTSKSDKKEKSYSDKEKLKSKLEGKEKDYREDKKLLKDDKSKEEKRKLHKEKDVGKDKGVKRSAEKPASPSPPPKKPIVHPHSPKRVSSPSNKSNSSASSKEETKPVKQIVPDVKKPLKPLEISPSKIEKKMKKEKKSHDKDRDLMKKEHKKDKEVKSNNENREIKSKELPKEIPLKDTPNKDKEKPPAKPDKPINKFSIENMLKDPQDAVKYTENSKHKVKSDRERKHKHKKKDKKRDESREKNRDSVPKEKKHKGEKKSIDIKEMVLPEKNESISISKDLDKSSSSSKSFKEKDRNQLTISPISHDTSSQSSTKSTNKNSKITKNPLDSMIAELGSSSDSDSDNSVMSDDEDMDSHKNIKIGKSTEPARIEPPKLQISDSIKTDKPPLERNDKNNQFSNSRMQKAKDKPNKQELKEEKKQRKRKTNSKGDEESMSKMSKSADDMDPSPKKRSENSNSSILDGLQRVKPESSRSKTDTKVQDDGVSSSLSDNPIKCDSPSIEDSHMVEPHDISPDYMMQLQELQQRIMTLQTNEELSRVVNLIAETGKYEVTKKTFDFDLCMLDRSTVQQLQELIGCESRA